MLQLDHITKTYANVEVLHSLSLTVRSGEFISLLGASGCGKTTLLRIIAGLDSPTSGRVHIGGNDVTDWTPSRRNIAMVFQSYALYPHKTVRENIAFPLRMRAPWTARLPVWGRFTPEGKKLAALVREKVPAMAEALNLGGLLERKPSQLSGGQKQRVALARALVREPSLFLMDEPLSNLDAKLRTEMRREIIALHRGTGKTFVYVTHDQTEAMTMSDRIVLLNQGAIQQIGSPAELYGDPANLFAATFIGSPGISVFPCSVDGDGLRVGSFRMRNEAAWNLAGALGPGQYRLGIRPESCFLCPSGDLDAIPAEVRLVEHMGNERIAHLDIRMADGAVFPARVRVPNDFCIPEKQAWVRPSWRHAFFFDMAGNRIRPAATCRVIPLKKAAI